MSDESSGTESSPVQLRLGFSPPTRAVTVGLALQGLQVIAEGWDRTSSLAWDYLLRAGISSARVDDGRGIVFPVSELRRLAHLPEQVRLAPDATLDPLVQLVVTCGRDGDRTPAVLDVDGDDLVLSWVDADGEDRRHPLRAPAQAALLACDLPFVATLPAWERLEATTSIPPTLGRARVNLDRFVEITSAKPQVVEGAPLPALFRIDATHFGMPLAYAHTIGQTPGFQWDTKRPRSDEPPKVGELPIGLSDHHRADLETIVERLVAYRSTAVVWDSGLGRRILALAAMEVLDAFPLLVVTAPWGTWVWQRHLDLLGRTHSVQHGRADVRVVTYRDLVARAELDSPYGIIFDALTCQEASQDVVRKALRRFDGLVDTYRVATDRFWPRGDLREECDLADILRPGEFRFSGPLEARYPLRTAQRAREHLDVYLLRRSSSDPTTDRSVARFRSSQVRVVEVNEAQKLALAHLGDSADPLAALAEACEVVSAGTSEALSAKVTAAVTEAREATAAGDRVAVVTAHPRTARLIRSALVDLRPEVVESTGEGDTVDAHRLVVVCAPTLPSLLAFDVVVIVDYPFSTAQIERACAPAYATDGPRKVVLLHMAGSVDDRLAMFAARRRELATVISPTDRPDAQAAAWLLTPRPLDPRRND